MDRRAKDHLEVLDMFFPADQKEYATEGEVTMAGHWWTLAIEYAAQQKMIVPGSAHTHPYRAGRDEVEAIPSIGDMESWEVPDLICGIVNVVACPLLVPMQHELTAHVTGCPMKAKMDTVEDWMTAMKATADANGYWLNRPWPAFYAAAGVAIYIAAMHANDFLKTLKP